MSPCHPFRPVPGQCGPNRRGPLPAPPFDPRDYWATKKFVSSLFESIETKIDKFDVVDPSAEAEAGKAADAKGTYEGLNRVLGVASDARVLAESKADQSALEAHVASTDNPHAVTASQVGAYTKEETNTRLDEKADRATTLSGYGITDAATKEELAAKADIVDGKVPAAQLPSYVDDVLEYDAVSAFPETGESGKIYVAKDTNLVYRWSGTQYVEISPSPSFDNTVTETSQNGVKSSGIWSWVKSLLPHWLTGDYAEPATVASVAEKRDKSDLAVYSVTRTENTDWRVEVSGELADVFISDIGGVYKLDMPYHDEYYWYYGPSDIGGWHCDLPEESISELNPVSSTNRYTVYVKGGDEVGVRFTRPRYMDETLGTAKQDQQLAAVATDDTAKPADGSLMKYDAANDRFVKAVEGTDYIKTHQDISGKFDATHDFDGENALLRWEAFYLAVYAPYGLYVLRGGMMADEHDELGRYVRTHSLFQKADRATTLSGYGITDGATKTELASAVSTNNPAFVSAVQNTPAPEPGQGEDPPWGTWGTVGAAIAGLVAGLKWLKDKVFDSAGNIQDQFATDLLGKQVANVKANTVSLAAAYSETKAYAVGDAVTHDGKLYKCAVAITTAEAWTPAHWTETTVVTLWNNADTTSYGGQN